VCSEEPQKVRGEIWPGKRFPRPWGGITCWKAGREEAVKHGKSLPPRQYEEKMIILSEGEAGDVIIYNCRTNR